MSTEHGSGAEPIVDTPNSKLAFSNLEWNADLDSEGWQELQARLLEKITTLLPRLEETAYVGKDDLARFEHYKTLISEKRFPTLPNWQQKLIYNLNDLTYLEAVLNHPKFAAAHYSFASWSKDLSEADRQLAIESRQEAEVAFAVEYPDQEAQVVRTERERRTKMLDQQTAERLKAASIDKLRRSGVQLRTQEQLKWQVEDLPDDIFHQQYSTKIMNDLRELQQTSDPSAAILLYFLENNLSHYRISRLFGKTYSFSTFKDNCYLVFRNWMKRLTLENGTVIAKYDEINLTDLQKLTDSLHGQYQAIAASLFPDQDARDAKLLELQAAQDEVIASVDLTEEEMSGIRTKCLAEAKANQLDPDEPSPLSDQQIAKAVGEMRNQFVNARLKHLPMQARLWSDTPWQYCNPKIITFANPVPTSDENQVRGFGGNVGVDPGAGSITLDFFGLPNYFENHPKFISSNENSTVYEMTETGPNGTETYKIRTRVGDDAKAYLDFICQGNIGQETITTVQFGEAVNLMNLVRKPVLYVYAPSKLNVQLELQYHGEIIAEYPKRKDNVWNVVPQPGGSVTVDGKQYPYLFWEGIGSNEIKWDFSESFCVAGNDSQQFLEMISQTFALNDKEKTDFITYWLAELQQNPYSLVSFPLQQYEQQARLQISPEPSQLIRMFMVFRRVHKSTQTTAPSLPAITRDANSFHVVEWGGMNLDKR